MLLKLQFYGYFEFFAFDKDMTFIVASKMDLNCF